MSKKENILILWNEETDTLKTNSSQELSKLKSSLHFSDKEQIIQTSSQAVYRISPVLLTKVSDSSFVYPKIKLSTAEDSDVINKHIIDGIDKIDSTSDKTQVKEKFSLKEDVFNYDKNHHDKLLESNIIEIVQSNITNGEEVHDEFTSIKKPTEEDDQRKNMDKYNLLRGFSFAYDPYSNYSKIDYDEDNFESEIKFEKVEDKLERILGIKI
jgi:hypothetical protein